MKSMKSVGTGILLAFLVFVSIISAAPLAQAAAATRRRPNETLVQLAVTTPAAVIGKPVAFSLAGTRIAKGSHLRFLRMSFGDRTIRRFSKLTAAPRHVYRHPGAYRVRVVLVTSRGAPATATRLVIVGAPTHVVLRRTTILLASAALINYKPLTTTAELLTLRAGTAPPPIGRTLLIGPSRLAPHGLIAIVTKVARGANRSLVVTVRNGTLSNAYSNLSLDTSFSLGHRIELAPTGHTNAGREFRTAPSSAVPFTCSTDYSNHYPVNVTADFSDTQISAIYDLEAGIFNFSVISKPVFSLGVTLSGSASCKLTNDFNLNIPIPQVPGLVFSVGPYFSLQATGSITGNASWTPTIILDISRGTPGGQTFFFFKSKASAGATGSASVTLQGGIQASLSVGDSVGLQAQLGPKLTAAASASVGTQGPQACLKVTSGLQLRVQLFANIFFVNATVILYNGYFDKSTIFSKCTHSSTATGSGSSTPPQGVSSSPGSPGPAPYSGPSIAETAGGPARTYSDYADGGGAQGATINAYETVGVVCRIIGLTVQDSNNWWYLIGSSPWNAAYYASADGFYNDGRTSGSLQNTPFYDPQVPLCPNSAGAPTQPTQTSESISITWGTTPAPAGNWMDITFTNFPTGPVSWYCVEEGTSYGPYTTTLTSTTETFHTNTCYDTQPGGSDYVTADGVNSNTIATD